TALAGNNLAGALASGASPYLATEIKKRVGEDNIAANAMAHAVLGAVTAQLNNQSATAGGLGAGGGELAARYISWIFGALRMTNKHQLKIIVSSDVDYEKLIAEIYCDEEFIALLQQEDGDNNIKVEFSPNIGVVDFDWLQQALLEARRTLLNK
ncbi:hypothetical protein, partial [Serratia montpellierensis]